jgi:REP element-mobilizing transposase RayT
MVRGIEGRALFRDDRDRQDLLARLAAVGKGTGLQVLAWALLPNHFHLLVRTGARPLATAMRRLLTGYAGRFNRRHRRRGHLFQNRYKSILVEEEPYLLEVTRYIHLNPLRAGAVRDLKTLDRYPWTGHSALLGRVLRPWQRVGEVLGQFGRGRAARQRYRAFVADGVGQGRRLELQGGGLRRSVGGWEALAGLRRGREQWVSDERVLGSSEFVAGLLRAAGRPRRPHAVHLAQLLARVARAWGLTPAELTGGGRRRAVQEARAAASYLAVSGVGLPAAPVARTLGVSLQSVLRGVERGASLLEARGVNAKALVSKREWK